MNASGCDSSAAPLAKVGGDRGGATGQAHRADHLEHRLGAVDLSALEARVEAEEVLLGEEPDRELRADRHVDLALEVLAQDDLDDVGIGGGLGEPALEHDRLDDLGRLAGPGGDPDEVVRRRRSWRRRCRRASSSVTTGSSTISSASSG